MKIIINIGDSLFSENYKDIEMNVYYDDVRRGLRECITTSSDILPKEQIKDALATRLKQLVSIEIENYVNSKIS